MLCKTLCNNCSFIVLKVMKPSLAWRLLITALVKFPRTDKIDRFVHNDRDRKTELLNLSLRYISHTNK